MCRYSYCLNLRRCYDTDMVRSQIVEYVFFFGFMAIVAYIAWQMLAPFVSALALSAIIVTICYPLYVKILRLVPRHNASIAALLTTIIVLLVVIFPFFFIVSSLVNEAIAVYNAVTSGSIGFESTLATIENTVSHYAPGVELNLIEYIKQATAWLAGNVGAIFAGTASTVFSFFIAMIGSFYLFRDGQQLTHRLVEISPLPNEQDELILHRLAQAVRSVATGTISVAIVQGVLTSIGLSIFGFERAVLWGTMAAFGALIPSVGTSIVLVPSVIYLVVTAHYGSAIGLSIWGMFAVGLIDNLLGPYLISRGNTLHPFVVLIAVLGGVAVFGPIGFIVGPVVISLLMVLLELYSKHISETAAMAAEDESVTINVNI